MENSSQLVICTSPHSDDKCSQDRTTFYTSSTRPEATNFNRKGEPTLSTRSALIKFTHARVFSPAGDGIYMKTVLSEWTKAVYLSKKADERRVGWVYVLSDEDHGWYFSKHVGKWRMYSERSSF